MQHERAGRVGLAVLSRPVAARGCNPAHAVKPCRQDGCCGAVGGDGGKAIAQPRVCHIDTKDPDGLFKPC